MAAQNIQKYLSARYKEINLSSPSAGPVITISREMGCLAAPIAEALVNKINQRLEKSNKKKWTWISKEILEKSAKDLNIDVREISHIFEGHERGLVKDIFQSTLQQHYISDSIILSTIKYIIRSYAYEGNVVIVGRASSIITNDIHKSLHIKLIAPYEFRLKQICEFNNITKKEAEELIFETDHQRQAFIKFFSGKKHETEYYDAILNRSKFDENQIVDILLKLVEEKKLI